MMKPILSVTGCLAVAALVWVSIAPAHAEGPTSARDGGSSAAPAQKRSDRIVKTEEEWKRALTPEQFRILRQQGTERAFSGAYWDNHDHGVYKCAGCGQVLFRSEEKFDSGTGWPSYWRPADSKAVETTVDRSHFMTRTEVHCSKCGGHLGHIFDDGPQPTGLRYCINSASLSFEKK